MNLSNVYRRTVKFVAACCAAVLVVSGCGSKEAGTGDEELDKVLASVEDYNPEDYVELGTYKGVEVNVYVSEDDIDGEIMGLLSQNTEVEQIKKGKVKDGDTVNIDFKGLMNGKEFAGGTSEGYSLTIGSKSFIDGFESGLIGVAVGDTTTLHLKFPDPYQNNPDFSGKDVDFEVKVNYINGKANVPEFNDEFVKDYTKGEYTSADAYRDVIKQQIADSKKETAGDTAFNTVLSTSKVKDIPDFLVDVMKLRLDASYRSSAKANGEEDFDKFITDKWNMTKEQYEEKLESTAGKYVEQKLIAEAIAKKENITVTDEEYKESLDQYMKNINVSTPEEFEKYVVANFKSKAEDIIKEAIITEKVINLVKENVVEVDKPENTDASGSDKPASDEKETDNKTDDADNKKSDDK